MSTGSGAFHSSPGVPRGPGGEGGGARDAAAGGASMGSDAGAFHASSLRRRRSPRPGRRAVVASVLMHAALVGLAVLSGIAARPQPVDFKVYRVDIVSPPPAPQPEPVVEEEAAAPEPEPRAPVVEEQPEPEPEAEPEPEPEQPEPEPEPPAREQPQREQPERREARQPQRERMDASELSGEDLRILLEGLESRYAAYFENVVIQIRRYFRPPQNVTASAEYFFYINRDGSVSDIRLVRSSGSAAFNIRAMGAIEAAGSRGAFGPLPEDFEYDRMPFLFYFEPPR